MQAPSGEKGGRPSNLSHPIAYAVSSNHTPINFGQQAMPDFLDKGWALAAATPMLKYASFMPNHPKIGQYNAIVFKGIQGVETGRLNADKAADFVTEELEGELGKDVVISK